jgi:hypothetical protein
MAKRRTTVTALFKPPSINIPPPPTPQPPPPMPDPFDPAAMETAKAQAAARAGRSSTILTTAANRGVPVAGGGGAAPYSGRSLGGG